jgi:hypothetical protein
MSNQQVSFTSVWDDGSEITTPGTYDPETGEVTGEVSKSPPPQKVLWSESSSPSQTGTRKTYVWNVTPTY